MENILTDEYLDTLEIEHGIPMPPAQFIMRGKPTAKRTHGMSTTPEYSAWKAMLHRTSEQSQTYKHYTGRGITVCHRWKRFECFLVDMGTRPSAKHSLDRINNDGNYEPGNCRWATQGEQMRNTRATRMVTINGQTQCLADWAQKATVPLRTVRTRLHRGWPVDRALFEPPRKGRALD